MNMNDFKKYTKIYADAEEKFVKNVVLYGKTGDKYIYSAKEATEKDKIDAETLLDLLHKGVIVSYADAFYIPVLYKISAGVTTLTIATKIATGASTAVELNSEEFSEE